MENKIIDLHIHTNKSDGTYTNKEVIDKAIENNVNIMSFADHDTIDAYNKEIFSYAKTKKITLIPAVEISTKIDKCGIHVLGYNININNEDFKKRLYELRNIRHTYLSNVTKKLNKLGYKVNIKELDKIESVTKSHIAQDIINKEENKELLLKNFNHLPNKGEFIETIMNEGCQAYVKKESITPLQAANLIRSVGGIPVLAHPVAYTYEDNLTDSDILNIIKTANIDTIEACYIYVDKNEIKHNEINHWLLFAKENNLHYTVGSDFHTEDGIRPQIGLINDLKLTEEQVKEITDCLNIDSSFN